ncbi:PaaX family transcriptional regulator C-terminal domain-containing protein [Actinomadura bangladeshensis]|jgi:phenylacetic acid degradation operon negative regulatory protein|uniref:PaaX domain-containing protein, C-domain protein n=1 Tax=Actinomadura bangladeshensis TaxID=453573 RepID=A0A6L9QBX7_9ACTN|nr:PaaX family transcriptional regulator C-terminal domain-containing protein [Actinomadura bangladeshensis]NEA23017.1 PaaX domain-containing protein, C- domain protein [Actinomadura bangladeshensis]
MDHPEIRPLTARSVVLSTLLGVHPPRLPARHLVRVGDLFGIAEGTVRVALSRMVTAGDLVQSGGEYTLTERLLARQARQDESRSPQTLPWDGTWEIAVITAERRPAADRAALRQAMSALRLAELREGTWLRPANLTRTRPAPVVRQCTFLTGRPEEDPAALAATLWDLDAWTTRAESLRTALTEATDIADRFTLAAAVLRHLLNDPLLPPPLLPPTWPGPALRDLYKKFEKDFAQLLTTQVLT